MSQSGVFRLILRDEKFDQFLVATDALKRRLAEVRRDREEYEETLKARGVDTAEFNPLPTLADVMKTHDFYLRRTYRPFVNVAGEYVKVAASGDSAGLTRSGGSVEFRFPTHAHFTSDMVFHVQIPAVGDANANTAFAAGVAVGPGLVAPSNPASAVPVSGNLRYRYCAYPGIRLFSKVAFRSDDTVVDDYTRDEVSMANKFEVPKDRRAAWDRCMGHGEEKSAEYYNNNEYTGVLRYRDGPQTPKFYQPSIEMWVPLQFFMCKDPANALLNDLLPNTQRSIVAELAPITDIIQAQLDVADPNRFNSVTDLEFDTLPLKVDLYVHNIFTTPEVYDILATRINHGLIRVHRRMTKTLTMQESRFQLAQLKYPAEHMYIGFRDKDNTTDQQFSFDRWHLFGAPRPRNLFTFLTTATFIWNDVSNLDQLVVRRCAETSTLEPAVSGVKLEAHGITLFPQLPASFFSSYLPQRYKGESCVVAPDDTSAMLVTFCVYPNDANPSGYYNLSAGRELYLSYRSETTNAGNPLEMFATMSALNFIITSGDKVKLMYGV